MMEFGESNMELSSSYTGVTVADGPATDANVIAVADADAVCKRQR